MNKKLTQSQLDEKVVEYTRLAKEFANFPKNGGNTVQEALTIDIRKKEINYRLSVLRKEIGFLWS